LKAEAVLKQKKWTKKWIEKFTRQFSNSDRPMPILIGSIFF